ncbi:benzoylformate decarboxylase [Prauserella marina]|uniref:Benzoylformate decarboxylase n=1 Tax=Prauserella marina TaxID=530584 RepID=A0A222VWG0_9PSEU|nr:benzoylformate decarboxylase [Prauserella marina]ASR38230.1 benzoylformate decarboxylase [Prauserella marina]PWV78578.1 benzoylformate decarboxylase [Prauserella marina]SDC89210.1 benzoylformate decarboxylase [Prauserella marina]
MGTVRDVTRELLREWGLTTVFGNPGTTEIPFLTDWPSDFRYVLGLQESVVVAMADGYAQAARRPAVVNLHSAGGVGHALGSVFTAYRNRSPLIILAGQQTRSLLPEDPFLGATDAAVFPQPYVKWSCEPARAEDVPAALSRAYHVATQPPYGPVFVSVPADDWDVETAPITARPRIPGFAADPDVLAELVSAIDAAVAPAIVVGSAVDQDGVVDEVIALAERTRAAVYESPMSSRCSFPEDHPSFLGFLVPERIALSETLSSHDLVIVLGAPAFTYHVYRGEAETALPPMYVVSDDEQVLARAPQGIGVRATVGLAVRALVERAGAVTRPSPRALVRPPQPAESTPVSGSYVYSVLAEMLPDDAVVVEEAPSHRNALHDHLPIRSCDMGFLAGASGTLGYALPAAIGVGIARPERKVVAVLGDGSSMYSIQALWTAVTEQVPVTFVVLDNSQYAAVRILGEAMGGAKLPGVDLGGIDFVALANGMGCATYQAEQPAELKAAFAAAFADLRPNLVHVRVDPSPEKIY